MRKLTFICALAIVFAISTVAFAEVQSIRVSGEINTYAIYQSDSDDLSYLGAGTTDDNADQFLESTIGLNFDADLTENVAAHLRLVSQRDWDNSSSPSTTQWDIGMAQAYITLSEMLYEPLTVRIGTQPLYFGRGFIIGSTMNDDFFNVDPESSIAANEYSLYDNSFDSINATLDYAPWTIDLGYIKVAEDTLDVNDDQTVWYTNVGYDFENEYAAEVEGYLLYDKSGRERGTKKDTNDEIFTIGVRGSMAPVANSSIFAEVAHQFGDMKDTPLDSTYYVTDRDDEKDIDAMAYEVGGEYAWVDVLTSPKIGLKYSYLEGDPRGNSGDYQGFTAPYMRKSDTAIFGWNGRLYDSAITKTSRSAAYTNLETILLTGNLKPLAAMDNEDVNLEVKYAHFQYNESPKANCNDDAGDELDLNLTYDYTEDVQFGLLSACFFPGKFYDNAGTEDSKDYNDTVYELVGSCKVTF